MSERRCQFCLGYIKPGEKVCENCGAPVMMPNLPAGVKFKIGVPSAGGTRVQSIMFHRDQWTPAKAKAWLSEHGYSATLDIPETGQYLHARQESPKTFKRIRTMDNPKSPLERRITAKKYEGDDAYSWAVFIDGHPYQTGLSKSEVPYWRKHALERLTEREAERLPTSKWSKARYAKFVQDVHDDAVSEYGIPGRAGRSAVDDAVWYDIAIACLDAEDGLTAYLHGRGARDVVGTLADDIAYPGNAKP